MKLIAKIGFILLLCCSWVACSDDEEYDPMVQRDNFKDFLDDNGVEYDENLVNEYIFKTDLPLEFQIEPQTPEGEPLQKGDRITINYIGYFFNSSSQNDPTYGREGVFTTNIQAVAEAIGLNIPEINHYKPLTIKLGDKKVLSGLNKGIPGSRVGDVILLYLTADDAYGQGNEIGTINKNSPVIYEIYIKEKID